MFIQIYFDSAHWIFIFAHHGMDFQIEFVYFMIYFVLLNWYLQVYF